MPDFFCGGPGGDRTHDLRVANAALSQLSYKPEWILNSKKDKKRG